MYAREEQQPYLVAVTKTDSVAILPKIDNLSADRRSKFRSPGSWQQIRRGRFVSEVPDYFKIEWHGSTVVVTPSAGVESLNWDLVERAADVIMEPLNDQAAPMVIVDLSHVKYFGSIFLALLLRCHKFVKRKGGELVLCGPSDLARELLRITALDTIWAIYGTRQEAMDALLN
jgi:anti-sigma B factor antagonist